MATLFPRNLFGHTLSTGGKLKKMVKFLSFRCEAVNFALMLQPRNLTIGETLRET